MKVLFVCTGNAARSQFAAAIYNKLTRTNVAESAGTEVTTGKPLPDDVLAVADEQGLDMTHAYRKQISESAVNSSDAVFLMTENSVPAYAQSEKSIFWNIDDPRGLGVAAHRQAYLAIEQKIQELLDD